MAGWPCRMDEIMEIAKRHKLVEIEDAAHAFGAQYKGKKIGTIGDLTVFSFYVTKNLATGEGGMVTTNNKKYSDLIKIYALHGMSQDAWRRYADPIFKHYLIMVPGYKYNMMDIQAAIGIHQLERFEENQKRRRQIWDLYNSSFSDLPITTPSDPSPENKHAYHLYTILVDKERLGVDREKILRAIRAENIGVGVHFVALHTHPYYKNKYKFKRGDFPNAEYISDRTISLPFSADLSSTDVKDVIRAVRKVILYYSKES